MRMLPERGGFRPAMALHSVRLAHAVAADHGEHAVLEQHRHALHGVAFAVIDMQVVDLEGRLPGGRRGVRRASQRHASAMAPPR